ncbi:uncharacterized protein LOC127785348 [Oryza glaberrima]|uniref:uncharacterized protein LOC127785348 n=1 Tax=Oryza glaberrima TaxID=4538 RepID=UPI00224C0D2A|nr:uncharacterized protein LOC127785348 [Oryza glaberrima]
MHHHQQQQFSLSLQVEHPLAPIINLANLQLQWHIGTEQRSLLLLDRPAMEGLIPFVFGVIKKRRRRRRRPPGRCYERLHSAGGGGGGGVYRSQSCRFPVRAPADEEEELELLYYDDGGRRRASPAGALSGEMPASAVGCSERGSLSRSLRFSSMRVLACVSGA